MTVTISSPTSPPGRLVQRASGPLAIEARHEQHAKGRDRQPAQPVDLLGKKPPVPDAADAQSPVRHEPQARHEPH